MNPLILSSLIGAGSSLLGGLFSREEAIPAVSSGDQARSHIDAIMEKAAQYKINPLTLLGSVGQQSGIAGTPASSMMGQAISDAGAFIADGVAKKADWDKQAEQLRMQNSRLQKAAVNSTLRPKVGGIFNGQSVSSPSDVFSSGGFSDGSLDRLAKELDPRFPTSVKPISVESGFSTVNAGGFSFGVPVVQDEIVGLNELPIVAGSAAVQLGRETFPVINAKIEGRSGPVSNGKSPVNLRAENAKLQRDLQFYTRQVSRFGEPRRIAAKEKGRLIPNGRPATPERYGFLLR